MEIRHACGMSQARKAGEQGQGRQGEGRGGANCGLEGTNGGNGRFPWGSLLPTAPRVALHVQLENSQDTVCSLIPVFYDPPRKPKKLLHCFGNTGICDKTATEFHWDSGCGDQELRNISETQGSERSLLRGLRSVTLYKFCSVPCHRVGIQCTKGGY